MMRAIVWVASIASLIGVSANNLRQFWDASGFWTRNSLLLAVVAGTAILFVDVATWLGHKPRRYKDEVSVNKYMLKLFKRGGSASIFANNLSWVRGCPEIKAYLLEQARNGKEFRVFVPRPNPVTEELGRGGIETCSYERLDYAPQSRFTLLNPMEPGSSILAVGQGAFPNFYIEELSDATHPRLICAVRDLLNIIEKVQDSGPA